MIDVVLSDAALTSRAALVRPVAGDWSAVNPAMRRLELAAGAELELQCRRLGELPVGSAVITGAGILAAQFMVHAVVRSADEPVTPAGVRRALQNALRRLAECGIDSAAIAPLGVGAGNLDAEESAHIMVPVLRAHVAQSGPPSIIDIVVESEYERAAFARELVPQ